MSFGGLFTRAIRKRLTFIALLSTKSPSPLFLFQITDLPEEDLLSHFHASNAFIEEGLSKEGAVLVHCYRGRSRSATVVAAFLMQKHGHSADRALTKVKTKREIVQPHDQFLAQLKLYENMDFTLDPENLQYKMFR